MHTQWDFPTWALVTLALATLAAILAGVRRADRFAADPGGRIRTGAESSPPAPLFPPLFPVAAAILAAWLCYAGALALGGRLLPAGNAAPPIALLLPPMILLAALAAFSPLGGRLARLPYAALIGFHVFRIPLELLLWAFHRQGRLPVQMTFEGRNLDVLTGIAALAVAWLAARGKAGRGLILAWNLLGAALLLNIMIVAVLSMPAPWRAFAAEPANELVLHFPYVYIPALFVMSALAGHLLVFRKLARAA